MKFENYELLCAAMGAVHKAGTNIDQDWGLLEEAIQKLVGAFQSDANARIHELTHGNRPMIESTDAARNAINALCEKYNVPLVCSADETSDQTVKDIASEAVRLLLGGDSSTDMAKSERKDRSKLTGVEWYCYKNPEVEAWYAIFFRVCREHGVSWASASAAERKEIECQARKEYERQKEEM